MTVEEYNEQFRSLKDQIEELKDRYAEEVCPYKVGDVVTIEGFSHFGKQGTVYQVEGIEGWYNKLSWRVRGKVHKKDGTESLQDFDFDETHIGWRNSI